MPITAQEYLENAVKTIAQRKLEDLEPLALISKNLWIYSWILQKADITVDRQILVNVLGNQHREIINYLIDNDPTTTGFVKQYDANPRLFMLTDEMMQAVATVFGSLLGKSRLLSGNITLADFIKAINISRSNLSEDETISLVQHCFRELLTSHNIIIENVDDSNIFMVSHQNGSWSFLVGVFPTSSAPTEKEIYEWLARLAAKLAIIRQQRNQQFTMNVLLISNLPETTRSINLIRDFPYLYHFWTLQFIQFLHLSISEELIQKNSQIASECFNAIFPQAMQDVISGEKAFNRWKTAIQEKKNLR